MIEIEKENEEFSLRVSGILIHNNRILLQKAKKENAWVLPGGHGEINERTDNTLVREMEEELGVKVSAGRLTWIIENFNAYGAEGYHEIGFYYTMNLEDHLELLDTDDFIEGVETCKKLKFKWFEISEISKLETCPSCLSQKLLEVPDGFERIVNIEQ